MRREDYIMRLIESLQGLLPYILDLLKVGEFHEAHAVIDQNLREMTGMGGLGLAGLDDAALLGLLQQDVRLDWREKGLFVATLLREDAAIYAQEEKFADSYDRFLTALTIFLALAAAGWDEDGKEAMLAEEISACTDILAEYHLPGRTYGRLMLYHEQQNEFAAAEDALFDWLQADPALAQPDDPDPLMEGLAFYERLQMLPDAELRAGGLSREELADGRAELNQYLESP